MPPLKAKKTLADVKQDLEVLRDPENPDVDIIAVPGLGADPKASWKSADPKNNFNWLEEGLVYDFPKARVMLYLYESAWTGPLKVRQYLGNIAMILIHAIRIKRKGVDECRPIVFISHSMGGLVVAKTLCLAESRRDLVPSLLESITTCIFFGTPFAGAPVATLAAIIAQAGELVNRTVSSKLLDLMKTGDEGLRELKEEFVRLALYKSSQKIDLYCFWEEQPTKFAELVGLPSIIGILIPKNVEEFVSRDSATLTGADGMGLACTHRNLVKFDGLKDERYRIVRDVIKPKIQGARLVVKGRLSFTRGIDRDLLVGVLASLEGAQVERKYKTLVQKNTASSWITGEQLFHNWLGGGDGTAREDCLWIRGPEGRGKTNAAIAAITTIKTLIMEEEEKNPGGVTMFLAFFFCDDSTDYNTAEDLLKSLLRQLIGQRDLFAACAKQFVEKKGNEQTSSRHQAKLTVENLWQSLQDMLTDNMVGNVVFVINNLHVLPEDADSTVKLMNLIQVELQSMNDKDKNRVPTRWLFTSRDAHNIKGALDIQGVRLVDLEDSKYGDQVQRELHKQAHDRILELGKEKKYNRALTYFASSLIGKRAQNTQWIDITCSQLAEFPEGENDLKVRRTLENVPQSLSALLDRSWMQIFSSSDGEVENVKELLRTLTLTFEDPSDAELAVLLGHTDGEEDRAATRAVVERCRPLLSLKKTDKSEYRVGFLNAVVKKHLQDNCRTLLGLDDEGIKWHHGMITLRCFSHLVERLSYPEPEPEKKTDDKKTKGDKEQSSGAGDDDMTVETPEDGDQDANIQEGDDEEVYEYDLDFSSYESEDEEEEEEGEGEADGKNEQLQRPRCLEYSVKNWLHHASKSTDEIADGFSREDEFWKPESLVRRRWLAQKPTAQLGRFERAVIETWTALHVASAIGFRQLVVSLMKNGHDQERDQHDLLFNTPLHLAAFFGRRNICEELLSRGAKIDGGIEAGELTPLHMASMNGNKDVMTKLVQRGANINAMDNDIGTVINAAIASGDLEAVQLLVRKGASLTHTNDKVPRSLALAAYLPDPGMFNYLREECELPAEEYDEALVSAAAAGNPKTLQVLFGYDHSKEVYQNAVDEAVEEGNWDCVDAIIDHYDGIDCNKAFFEAATIGSEEKDQFLEKLWKYVQGDISKETLDKSLYLATDREKQSTVEVLLKYGADPNAVGEEFGNALTASASDGTDAILSLLLDAGADIHAAAGWPLQGAAAQGHESATRLLLQRGADVNALTHNTEHMPQGTALQAATEAGQAAIVTLLLEHDADPNLGAGPDAYPIVAAARMCGEIILGQLVAAGANVNVRGGEGGWPPLVLAAYKQPARALAMLLDAGAEIDAAADDGNTALVAAAACGDDECVRLLLNRGADILRTNNKGVNALQAAFENGDKDCLPLLVEHVSVLLGALQGAVGAGNEAVARVVREAHLERTAPGEETSPTEEAAEGDGEQEQQGEAAVVSRAGEKDVQVLSAGEEGTEEKDVQATSAGEEEMAVDKLEEKFRGIGMDAEPLSENSAQYGRREEGDDDKGREDEPTGAEDFSSDYSQQPQQATAYQTHPTAQEEPQDLDDGYLGQQEQEQYGTW